MHYIAQRNWEGFGCAQDDTAKLKRSWKDDFRDFSEFPLQKSKNNWK